ncbi:MAG: MotE family protein [bacterium]
MTIPKPRFPTSARLLPVVMIALGLVLVLRVAELFDGAEAARPAAAPPPPPTAHILSPISPAMAQERPAAQPAARRAAEPVAATRSAIEESTGFSAAEIEILQELSQRRAAIDKQARDLSEREALLQAAEQQIERKLQELNQLKASMEAPLRRADEQDEARKKTTARLFEGMKPAEAARIMEQMELPQLVELLERMKERSASMLLAQMHPVRARQVAAEMTKRRVPAGSAPRPG